MQADVILRRTVILLDVIAALIIIALGFHVFVQPSLVKAIYSGRYEDVVAKCDRAGNDRLLVKAQLPASLPSATKTLLRQEAGDQSACDASDSLRNHLLSLGLTDNDLSELGVKAMEDKEPDVSAFVQIHQFKY